MPYLIVVGSGLSTSARPANGSLADLKGKPRRWGPRSSSRRPPPRQDMARPLPWRPSGSGAGQELVRAGRRRSAGPPVTLPAGANLLIRGTAAGSSSRATRPATAWRMGTWQRPENLPDSPANGISDGRLQGATGRLRQWVPGPRNSTKRGLNGYDVCEMLRVLNVVSGRL